MQGLSQQCLQLRQNNNWRWLEFKYGTENTQKRLDCNDSIEVKTGCTNFYCTWNISQCPTSEKWLVKYKHFTFTNNLTKLWFHFLVIGGKKHFFTRSLSIRIIMLNIIRKYFVMELKPLMIGVCITNVEWDLMHLYVCQRLWMNSCQRPAVSWWLTTPATITLACAAITGKLLCLLYLFI